MTGRRYAIADHETTPVRPLRLVSPDGVLDAEADGAREVTPELVRALHRDMVLGRRLDEEAYMLQRQGELGLWLMSLGQEAAQVGSIRAARADDHVFPSYREHVAALCRGIGPGHLLAQWRGTAHGSWDPQEHRFHNYSLVLATQTLHATGYAIGVAFDSSDEVVLAYLGDGATSQGDANEAFNWAAVTDAPIVFFCQNNQWAISTPASKQTRTPLYRRAAGFGLRSYCVDGNDVLAVHAVTRAAIDSTRRGEGPAFIEALTYRRSGHSTSDDPRRYRPPGELAEWEAADPVARTAALLERNGWADVDYREQLAAESDELAARTRRECLQLRAPDLSDTFRATLSAETAALRAEREQFERYQESFV